MRTLVADVSESLRPRLYCRLSNGELDEAVTHTLLFLIVESVPPSDDQLHALIEQAELGKYFPKNPDLPDWSVNDKDVWVVPPMARAGCICISNENSGKYASDGVGTPQQFTYEQFRSALLHWKTFTKMIEQEGRNRFVGRCFETTFPD